MTQNAFKMIIGRLYVPKAGHIQNRWPINNGRFIPGLLIKTYSYYEADVCGSELRHRAHFLIEEKILKKEIWDSESWSRYLECLK